YRNDNQSAQFGNQRKMTVAEARENVGSLECRKPKRVKDSAYHKEKMLLCKQAEQGVPLQAEQSDWLVDTDEEIDEQELEAHYSYMAKIQEVTTADSGTDSKPLEQVQYDAGYNVFANEIQHFEQSESISNTCVVETDDSNVIPDSPDMCDNDIQNDQNAIECDDGRVVLANLIANLTLDVDENKKIQKELKKASASLTQELTECKSILAETSRTLGGFDKPSVVRQPNAQRIPKPSVLGKPDPFSDSLERKHFSKRKSVPKTNVSEGLSRTVTTQNLPQTARQAVRNNNVIKPGMYRIDSRTTQTRAPQLPQTSKNTNPRVSTSTGVIHKTNVSRPQLRSTLMKDKVVPNNTQVKYKKTKVEDHPRISSISKKTKFVTTCNDSLNSRTLNVNVVCATCKKCLVDSDHFAYVTKFLNDVNARTKKHNVVPVSSRKPNCQAKKFVATSPKKTVASESTTQKSNSYYRMLYNRTSKAWKWWIEQQCPSGFKWVPKTRMIWVPKVRNENVQKRVSFAIDNVSRITNVLKLTNSLGSNLSNVPSSSNSLADCSTHPIHY
ncbi:hypothetical protein Tco_0755392, partial [Tanacetum coccineum]